MASLKERLEVFDRMVGRERAIMEAKANDYSGTSDCNKNIMACEVAGICSAETGLLIRLGDKMCRLVSLLSNGNQAKVKDESVSDTISDMRNYLCILQHIIEMRNVQKE